MAPPPAPQAAALAAAETLRVIASVRGTLLSRLPGEAVIEAAGVGYRLSVSL